jgi:hypothetical protein
MAAVAYNQPDADYRRELGENQSYLKNILVSPAHYKAAKVRRFPVTTNMEVGSALHCKALEGDDEFNQRFLLKPDGIAFNTKEGKDWKASNKGKTILAKQDYDNVLGMAEALSRFDWFNPDQPDYRKYNELSIYWEADGIPCKGRLDRLVEMDDHLLVLDLKTTDSVDFSTFLKKVVGGMNYVFQAAWYAEAASLAFNKPAKFVFIGIERAEPWATGVFEVSDDMMTEGIAQINKARKILKECLRTKEWPRPKVSYNVLELPTWYRTLADEGSIHEGDLF